MTISIPAAAPLATSAVDATADDSFHSLDEERDAGIRAFRGLVIASGLALAFWSALGAIVWGLFQIPR